MLLMKKKNVIILFLAIAFTAKAQDSLKVTGTINPKLNGRLLKIETNFNYHSTLNLIDVADSCIIKDGKFSLTVPAHSLEGYTISIPDKQIAEKIRKGIAVNSVSKHFFLMPKAIKIDFLDTLLFSHKLSDSIENQKINSLSTFEPHERLYKTLSWLKENKNTAVAIYGISNLKGKVPDSELRQYYTELPDSLKFSSAAKELDYYLENLTVGKPAPEFALSDTTGKKIKLSDYKGKYVLIEFWASWCIPCRRESPNLMIAHNKYNAKGFEILNVSIDRKKEEWVAAIKQDKLFWPQVLDLEDGKSYVAMNQYKVYSIPDNFLIDPEGKIIAKNLTSKQTLERLKMLKL